MPLLWGQIVRARRAGAKLIVVDPQRTHEAELADVWLQNRPGSDTALALSLIHVIVREGLHDAAFVEEHTAGFDDLCERALDYSPATGEQLSWVPGQEIVAAARMIARDGPTLVHGGNGLCQSGTNAVQSARALACLIAITGNIGRDGAHALNGPPRDLVANGDAVLAPALSNIQREKRLGAETFAQLGRGYGALDEAMSGAWYGKRHVMSWLATAHEPTLWRAITAERPYPVKALILQCHNAVGAGANAKTVAEALTSEKLDLLVVHDLFLNATSRLADYILPASHWLEKPFLSLGYGYMGMAGDYAEAKPAPISAAFEHRSDYELWRDLGRRLGQESYWPETAEEFWDGLLEPAGLDFASLSKRRGPVTGAGARQKTGAGDVAFGTPSGVREAAFGTPSGKIELRSSLLESWGIDPLPYFELPAIFAGTEESYPLVLTTGGASSRASTRTPSRCPGFARSTRTPSSACTRTPRPMRESRPETGFESRRLSGPCDSRLASRTR